VDVAERLYAAGWLLPEMGWNSGSVGMPCAERCCNGESSCAVATAPRTGANDWSGRAVLALAGRRDRLAKQMRPENLKLRSVRCCCLRNVRRPGVSAISVSFNTECATDPRQPSQSSTVTVAVSVWSFSVAVTVVVPWPVAVTSPVSSTVATLGLSDAQSTFGVTS
jgi:hypothetical protein